MQTALNMNGHLLRDSVQHIVNGFLDSAKGSNRFALNGAETISLPGGATLTNIDVYCMRKVSSSGHVSVITHKRISFKIFSSLKSHFSGNLGSSRVFGSQRSGWFQTINPNSFKIPSSGILAIDPNTDAWKSYHSITLFVEYRTSA